MEHVRAIRVQQRQFHVHARRRALPVGQPFMAVRRVLPHRQQEPIAATSPAGRTRVPLHALRGAPTPTLARALLRRIELPPRVVGLPVAVVPHRVEPLEARQPQRADKATATAPLLASLAAALLQDACLLLGLYSHSVPVLPPAPIAVLHLQVRLLAQLDEPLSVRPVREVRVPWVMPLVAPKRVWQPFRRLPPTAELRAQLP